jgi:hypothetical protein
MAPVNAVHAIALLVADNVSVGRPHSEPQHDAGSAQRATAIGSDGTPVTHAPQSAGQFSHVFGASQVPSPQFAGIVEVDVLVVLVLVVELLVDDVVGTVVVVGTTQPPAPHASQQLGTAPTQPPSAMQRTAVRFVRHFVTPFLVRQHVTRSARPHVDFAAHWMTFRRQTAGNPPAVTDALTIVRAQRM